MRLISIAQGSAAMAAPPATTPSSLRAALEATRHASLPPPRIDGFSFSPSTTGNVAPPQQPVAVISGASGAPPAPVSSGIHSPLSSGVSSGGDGSVHAGAGVLPLVGSNIPVEGLGAEAGARTGTGPSPFSDLLSSSSTKHSDGITGKAHVAAAGVTPMSDLMLGLAPTESPATAAEEQGEGDREEEDDDFGDFEGAEDAARASPPPQPVLSPSTADAAVTSPLVAFQPSKTENDEEFGDFSGAPDVIPEEVASIPATVSASEAFGVTPASRVSEDGQSGGASVMEGGVGQHQQEVVGLDELMRSNLKEAVSRPVNLADVVSLGNGPSCLGLAFFMCLHVVALAFVR